MARVFTCGFEENSIVAGATMWNGLTGTPTVVASGTTAPRAGAYCLQVSGTAAANVHKSLSGNDNAGIYHTRFALKFGANPGESVRIAFSGSATPTLAWHVNLKSDGAAELVASIPTTVVATTAPLATDTWHVLEVRHVISDTVGELELRLAGSTVGSALTGIDTLPINFSQWRFGQTGAVLGASFTFWLDDIAINDETGAAHTSWCGLGRNASVIVPVADTATNQWTPSAGTDHFELVNDMPGAPDDGTTYLQDGNTTNVERFAITAPAEIGATDTLVLLDVYGRGGVDVASANTVVWRVWDEAGTSTDHSLTQNVNNTSYVAGTVGPANSHFPYDLTGKTKANLEDFNIGFKGATGTTNNKRVTAIWANVEYIPNAGAAFTSRMSLLGVG